MPHISEVLKKLREQKGMGLNEFAKELNLPATTVSGWEVNKMKPRANTLRKLAAYFKMTYPELMALADDKHKIEPKLSQEALPSVLDRLAALEARVLQLERQDQ